MFYSRNLPSTLPIFSIRIGMAHFRNQKNKKQQPPKCENASTCMCRLSRAGPCTKWTVFSLNADGLMKNENRSSVSCSDSKVPTFNLREGGNARMCSVRSYTSLSKLEVTFQKKRCGARKESNSFSGAMGGLVRRRRN